MAILCWAAKNSLRCTGMKQYECTQPLLGSKQWSTGISVRSLKGSRQINNNHDIHKTQSLIKINHPKS
jgi:hypothetical protein